MNSPPPAATRLLLLEDDPAIARTVMYTLEREGFHIDHVRLIRDARAALADASVDLAVLDVGLPDGNGLDLCRELRQRGSTLPIVLLTARSDETDRVVGLELGADDYIAKPFSPRELVARLRALLRRARMQSVPAAASGPAALFAVDEAGGRIAMAGRWLSLTRRELGLLQRLLESPGRIHSRDALLDAVWGPSADSNDRTVDTHIKTLRAKLREVRPDLDPIVTHRGIGYSLELPVS